MYFYIHHIQALKAICHKTIQAHFPRWKFRIEDYDYAQIFQSFAHFWTLHQPLHKHLKASGFFL